MARARRSATALTSKHPLVRRVERFSRATALFTPGHTVLVAVSGGADSVFLLRALHALSPVLDLRLAVGHFNHGWRGAESDADEHFVTRLADTLELPFHRGAARTVRATGESPEAQARDARYRFLGTTASRIGAVVATGHTLDDQLETYLLGWLRGSGPAGASCMPPAAPLPVRRSPVCLVRPLLSVAGDDVREALSSAGQPWREDRTNADPRYLRNRVRGELVPLLESLAPGARRTLLRSARLARQAADFLRRTAKGAAAELFAESDQGVAFDRASFLALDHALSGPLLLLAVECLTGSATDVGAVHVDGALSLIERGTGGTRGPLGPAAEVRLSRGRVLVAHRRDAPAQAG